MQTHPAVEQSKIIRWSKSPWNQSGPVQHNVVCNVNTCTNLWGSLKAAVTRCISIAEDLLSDESKAQYSCSVCYRIRDMVMVSVQQSCVPRHCDWCEHDMVMVSAVLCATSLWLMWTWRTLTVFAVEVEMWLSDIVFNFVKFISSIIGKS